MNWTAILFDVHEDVAVVVNSTLENMHSDHCDHINFVINGRLLLHSGVALDGEPI